MLGGLLLAPVLIVHILVEHLMYAWWVITCPCSNSAHIGRTSDVCLVGYYLPLFYNTVLLLVGAHIRTSHVSILARCSNMRIFRTSDVCLVGYYLPLFY